MEVCLGGGGGGAQLFDRCPVPPPGVENNVCAINVLFIDELVDSGMDTQGVENSLALLKKMSRDRNKSVWLVSHRDELAGRVGNILRVVKEGGFTSYVTDIDTA